jgi:hypothetical protein
MHTAVHGYGCMTNTAGLWSEGLYASEREDSIGYMNTSR